ncbi:hypothetical protein FNV43_RR07259 [Rhamnella rubrinervis]|uniref:Uncharacterized protein n=1 Tax=Rhamnella rubrinervis TaxID=2594499 RepID=A0A8K0HEL7_9ROSA|nr:hypothetical protein FNV43_RR07259 [Rhamnella rubrinervis]
MKPKRGRYTLYASERIEVVEDARGDKPTLHMRPRISKARDHRQQKSVIRTLLGLKPKSSSYFRRLLPLASLGLPKKLPGGREEEEALPPNARNSEARDEDIEEPEATKKKKKDKQCGGVRLGVGQSRSVNLERRRRARLLPIAIPRRLSQRPRRSAAQDKAKKNKLHQSLGLEDSSPSPDSCGPSSTLMTRHGRPLGEMTSMRWAWSRSKMP